MSDQITAESYMVPAAEEACPGVERLEKKMKQDTIKLSSLSPQTKTRKRKRLSERW